ncbi:pyridoxamine 5'-phosphate oxidase family protein [Speluncibacter jeojiensis]|uniref:Pyridoxamine 5'-phosphate oxidase family protein n=1 Tax=Speluncibacter jeojiensis TaxID=2710754 RepID=A0A9X4RCJ8_9ACTN|nr:pyridoxamine 5'-phosphate oxidase family protein [Corynebacteriales bacterium D3-21]
MRPLSGVFGSHPLLADAFVCHLGITLPDHPLVLPTAFGFDPSGPDDGGSLYVHGSVAARWLVASPGAQLCATVTMLDGLVVGRSAFHHSMNYRSAVILGAGRLVDDPAEKDHALELVVDHMIPGRTATLRRSTRKELAATAVVAIPMREASVKARGGGPGDEPEDVATGTWGGHIPLQLASSAPVPDNDATGEVPDDVAARARSLG